MTDSRPLRLLVIEDSPRDRDIYRRALHDFGLDFAESGEVGLNRLSREPFDAVVVDYQLPGIDGGQVLDQIQGRTELDLPVLVITGGGSEALAADLLRRGADDYVTKDELTSPRLLIALRGALERHRLDQARRFAEAELRIRNEELEATLDSLREAQAHLVQGEKLASLGELVAGVAHEINNPLSYVINNMAVLERDVREVAQIMAAYRTHLAGLVPRSIRDDEERVDLPYTLGNLDRLLQSSRQGLDRVREIVSGLCDFVKQDEGDRKPIDPNEAIKVVADMVRYYARQKGVDLVVEPGNVPVLWCYAGKLNQVLLNIIMNAIQAVEPGGTVALTTHSDPDRSEVRFVVADTGTGIPDAIRDKVFDPFFTTKPPGVGTGLGLWISYNTVQEHRGRLDLETAVGQGAVFTITLPARWPSDPL
ncbi:MAG: ATP-binding protein [Isosphaeraceae bacterium]